MCLGPDVLPYRYTFQYGHLRSDECSVVQFLSFDSLEATDVGEISAGTFFTMVLARSLHHAKITLLLTLT